MTMENSDDLAIETLLAVSAELAPDLEIELLKRCYAIQKAHQFALDRTQSTQAMDRLIEDRVNRIMSSGDGSEVKK
jgi:hypothetical protein